MALIHNVSSGMSMCGESSGFLSNPCQCGEENHSYGTTPEPVPGNVTPQGISTLIVIFSLLFLKLAVEIAHRHFATCCIPTDMGKVRCFCNVHIMSMWSYMYVICTFRMRLWTTSVCWTLRINQWWWMPLWNQMPCSHQSS